MDFDGEVVALGDADDAVLGFHREHQMVGPRPILARHEQVALRPEEQGIAISDPPRRDDGDASQDHGSELARAPEIQSCFVAQRRDAAVDILDDVIHQLDGLLVLDDTLLDDAFELHGADQRLVQVVSTLHGESELVICQFKPDGLEDAPAQEVPHREEKGRQQARPIDGLEPQHAIHREADHHEGDQHRHGEGQTLDQDAGLGLATQLGEQRCGC